MRWDPNSYPRGHPFCGAYSFTPADSRIAFFCKFRMRLGSASKDAAAPSAYSLPAFAAYDGGSGGGEEGRVRRVERTRRGGGKRKSRGRMPDASFFADTSAHTARRDVSIARASRRGTVAGRARGGTKTRGAHLAAGLAEEHGRLAQHLLRLGPHGRGVASRFPRRIYRVGVGGRRAGGERLDGADAFPEGEIRTRSRGGERAETSDALACVGPARSTRTFPPRDWRAFRRFRAERRVARRRVQILMTVIF